MTKDEFIGELDKALVGLPVQDLKDRLMYYTELIEGRMEGGLSEEAAVASVGTVGETVGRIMSEISIGNLVTKRPRRKTKRDKGKALLMVLGFPIWFPLTVAAFALFLAFNITIAAVLFALFVVDLALAAAGFLAMFVSIPIFFSGNIMGGIFVMGAGLLCLGLVPFSISKSSPVSTGLLSFIEAA